MFGELQHWYKRKSEDVANSSFARRSTSWVETGSWDDNQGIPRMGRERWSGILALLSMGLAVVVVFTGLILVFVVL
jgi:hypothetical protein